MKTLVNRLSLAIFLIILQVVQPACSQAQITGKWTGLFMNDFKTIVNFYIGDEDTWKGAIQMYSGENQIQNDELSEIKLDDVHLFFYIKSKETNFIGEFNDSFTELKGEFIFPDKSKHPLTLIKSEVVDENVKNSSPVTSSEVFHKPLSVDEMKEDFNFLIKNLETLHPNLYAFTTKEEINELISKTSENIHTELHLNDFFRQIAPVVECIKCSHTGIRLPDNYREEISKQVIFLPVEIVFVDEKAFFIKNSVSSTTMILGDEVLAINNLPVQNIKNELFKFIPSEGMNSTSKKFYLNQSFNWLYHTIDPADSFEIEYSRNGNKYVDNIEACTYSDFIKWKNVNEEKQPLTFVFDDENFSGILTIRSFMFPDINEYIQKLDNIFTSLQQNKTKHLIIDLRGNSGGHPIFAAQLFSYLTNKEFTYFKRNSKVTEFEPLYNPMQPNNIRFAGNLYILTDGGCLSTTGHLISLLKYHTNAIFIGEEPGSSYSCNDFSVELRLPNSGIKVNIPRTTFETAINDFKMNHRDIVDYNIKNTVDNLGKDKDEFVEVAYKLMEKYNL